MPGSLESYKGKNLKKGKFKFFWNDCILFFIIFI